MFESKYSKLLTGLLIAGIVAIVAILIAVACFIANSAKIKQDADDAAGRFNGKVNNITENVISNTIEGNEISPIIGLENVIVDNNSTENRSNTYKGFPMVGTIEIPATNLKCPVLENASKAAIEVAVGIYDGPGLNEIGHNYRNGKLFSNNKKLVEGDKIYITDSSGKKVTYIIYKTYTTSPEDSTYLDRDTEGKREISLTTCTDDTQSRLIIWAREQ